MIRKIKSSNFDKFLNKYYFSRFDNKNLKLSISKKVKLVDHYIWWFSNKREFQIYELSNKKLIFFWYQKFFFKKKFFWSCGFHVDSNSNLTDIIKSYSNFLKFLKKRKKIPIVGIVIKKNIFLKKLNQDLGFERVENTNDKIFQAIKKFYNVKNSSNLIFLKL
tara:strand:+ start:15 stop:503 length:489 start_codon:yes stop_codon:yes gene_type:complete